MAIKMKITDRTPVAVLYPSSRKITFGTLKKHFSRERMIQLANEPLEAQYKFAPNTTYNQLIGTLLSWSDVVLNADADLRPLPEDISRIMFIQRKMN
jgi:hypothetical protein